MGNSASFLGSGYPEVGRAGATDTSLLIPNTYDENKKMERMLDSHPQTCYNILLLLQENCVWNTTFVHP